VNGSRPTCTYRQTYTHLLSGALLGMSIDPFTDFYRITDFCLVTFCTWVLPYLPIYHNVSLGLICQIHKMGRRIQLYVSADIVHLNSTFFNASWPWQQWADWPSTAGPSDPAKNHNASTLCHAFDAWQEQVSGLLVQ
jgi:hypothetical protein